MGFIRGFVAAGTLMLISNVAHAITNTEIVGPDEEKGRCCVVKLSAVSPATGRNRRANVPNELMCPLKPDRDNLKINKTDHEIFLIVL